MAAVAAAVPPWCPSTPPGPSSSSSQSSYHSNLLATPPSSRSHRRQASSSHSLIYSRSDVTPPSSPQLLPCTPSSSSSRTLHLRSPHKPTRPVAQLTSGPPSSASIVAQSAAVSAPTSLFTVKGNVTPSRASAFFAPRSRARRPDPSRGVPATPSSHTSARRGAKRQRTGTSASSPSMGRQRMDRMVIEQSHVRQDSSSSGRGQPEASYRHVQSSDDSDEDGEEATFGGMDWDDDGLPPYRSSRGYSQRTFLSQTSPLLRASGAFASTPRHRSSELGVLSGSSSPSPRKPAPLAERSRISGSDVATALARMRCGTGGMPGIVGLSTMAMRRSLSRTAALSNYALHPEKSVYSIGSSDGGHSTQPLCCAYSYSSKAYTSTRQWLAVGDNEGQLTLLDTAQDAMLDSHLPYDEQPTTPRPVWSADAGALFTVAWRHDDRLIASSGSDFILKLWDTSTFQQVKALQGSHGTSRAVVWDPHSNGNLLASGGRDGAVHIFDIRTSQGRPVLSNDPVGDLEVVSHVDPAPSLLSLWSAHAKTLPSKTRRTGSQSAKGVTSVIYHRYQPHSLFTAGCADATVKLWDLRFAVHASSMSFGVKTPTDEASLARSTVGGRMPFGELDQNRLAVASPCGRRKSRKPRRARPGDPSFIMNPTAQSLASGSGGTGLEEDPLEIMPFAESDDLSMASGLGRAWNGRSHGISSLVQSEHDLFVACTDGRIYSVPLSSFSTAGVGPTTSWDNSPIHTLHHAAQCGNSLFSPLALCPDERTLAMGCNSGTVVLWDTTAKKAVGLSRRWKEERPSSSSSSQISEAEEEGEEDEEEDGNPFSSSRSQRRGGQGQRRRRDSSSPSASGGGEDEGSGEINALDWCYDAYTGWRLASASDDLTVRVWEADAALAGRRGGEDGGRGRGEARGHRRGY